MSRVLVLAREIPAQRVIELVGPKGYIHGWIYVGPPGVGLEVRSPRFGKGQVVGKSDTSVRVQYKSGRVEEYELKPPKAKGAGKGKAGAAAKGKATPAKGKATPATQGETSEGYTPTPPGTPKPQPRVNTTSYRPDGGEQTGAAATLAPDFQVATSAKGNAVVSYEGKAVGYLARLPNGGFLAAAGEMVQAFDTREQAMAYMAERLNKAKANDRLHTSEGAMRAALAELKQARQNGTVDATLANWRRREVAPAGVGSASRVPVKPAARGETKREATRQEIAAQQATESYQPPELTEVDRIHLNNAEMAALNPDQRAVYQETFRRARSNGVSPDEAHDQAMADARNRNLVGSARERRVSAARRTHTREWQAFQKAQEKARGAVNQEEARYWDQLARTAPEEVRHAIWRVRGGAHIGSPDTAQQLRDTIAAGPEFPGRAQVLAEIQRGQDFIAAWRENPATVSPAERTRRNATHRDSLTPVRRRVYDAAYAKAVQGGATPEQAHQAAIRAASDDLTVASFEKARQQRTGKQQTGQVPTPRREQTGRPSPSESVDERTREIRRRWEEAENNAPEGIRQEITEARYASPNERSSHLRDLLDKISNAPDFAGRDYVLGNLRSKLAAAERREEQDHRAREEERRRRLEQVERAAQEQARQADEAAANAPAGTQLEQLKGNPNRFLVRRDGKLYGIIQGQVTDDDGRTRPARPGEVPTSYQAITPSRYRLRLGGTDGMKGPSTTSKKTATMQEAVNHITKRADAMEAETRKDMQAAREEGLFDVPAPPRVRAPKEAQPWEPKPGEVGGTITIEGGRTGQVWADAPNGGKWVIPDQRREGEAYAIYVDRRGRVDPTLSSREYQQQWLRARDPRWQAEQKRQQERVNGAFTKASKTAADLARKGRPLFTARLFKDLSDEELELLRQRWGSERIGTTTEGLPWERGRGGVYIRDLVEHEQNVRRQQRAA